MLLYLILRGAACAGNMEHGLRRFENIAKEIGIVEVMVTSVSLAANHYSDSLKH